MIFHVRKPSFFNSLRFSLAIGPDADFYFFIFTISDDEKITLEVTIRVYNPKQEPDRPIPIGAFGHGGGFCGGDLNTDDKTARFLAEHLPCIVVSIDYLLGIIGQILCGRLRAFQIT